MSCEDAEGGQVRRDSWDVCVWFLGRTGGDRFRPGHVYPAHEPLELRCSGALSRLGKGPSISGVAGRQGTRLSRSLSAPSPQVYSGVTGVVTWGRPGLLPYSCIALRIWRRFVVYSRRAWVSRSVSMSRVRNGLPYVISQGLSLVVVSGAA